MQIRTKNCALNWQTSNIRLTAEMKLIILLLRASNKQNEETLLQDMLQRVSNWPWFIRLIGLHGVISPIHRFIHNHPELSIPLEVRQEIAQNFKKTQFKSLKLSALLSSLAQSLHEHDIRFLSLKGPALSQELYNDSTYRTSQDIDLLIHPDDYERCHILLEKLGAKRVHPASQLTPLQDRLFKSRDNAAGYIIKGQLIEIHWRLFENPHLLDRSFDKLYQKRRTITLGGVDIPILNKVDQALYIFTHSAKHLFVLLKWVSDCEQILSNINSDEYESFLETAQKEGLLPLIQASLMTLNAFFPQRPEYSAINKNSRPRKAISIFKGIQFSFCQKAAYTREISKKKANSLIFLRQFSLKKSLRYHLRLLARWSINTHDWTRLPLPDILFPLYLPLRPILWLTRPKK